MKTCSVCKAEKSYIYFSKDRKNRQDGYQHKCKSCTRKYQKEYTKRTKTKNKRLNRHLEKTYNITLEEFLIMSEKQNNTCYICGKQNTYKKTKRLVVDHCHDTGAVRGLLCTNCNTGLGMFGDNIKVLKKAIKYLEQL